MSHSAATPWTVAHQSPLFVGFPRKEYQSKLPLPSPGDLPNPGIEPASPTMQADSLPLSHQGSSFVSSLMFIIFFLLLSLGLIYSSFCNSLRCQFMWFIQDLFLSFF